LQRKADGVKVVFAQRDESCARKVSIPRFNNSITNMQIQIANEDDLQSVATILHDARFTVDAIDFDAATSLFTLKCWTLEPKPKQEGVTRAWQAHRLLFTSVIGCKVNVNEKVVYYELSTLRFSKGDSRLDLFTHYAIEMSLQLGKLEGSLTAINERREQWHKSESSAA
jgi:hypothetical protein